MWGFSGASVGKEPPCNPRDARDMGSTPGSGRSPGGEHSYSLQYSCLENLMDRRAWWATVHRLQRVGHGWSEWAQHMLSYNDLNIIGMDMTPLPQFIHTTIMLDCFLHVSYAFMPLLLLSFLLGFLTHFVQVVTVSILRWLAEMPSLVWRCPNMPSQKLHSLLWSCCI